jgi:quercetin dioxygenase-like cupin family protein
MDGTQARTWNVLGEHVTCRAASEDTDGTFSLFEVVSPPGGGPPLHVHEREDESFYVLDGELLVQSGDRRFPAGPGAFVRFPRGIPHAYRNVSDRPVRLLVVVTPGGYEHFFEAMAQVPMPPDGPPDIGRVIAVAQRFGVQVVGPPLGG